MTGTRTRKGDLLVPGAKVLSFEVKMLRAALKARTKVLDWESALIGIAGAGLTAWKAAKDAADGWASWPFGIAVFLIGMQARKIIAYVSKERAEDPYEEPIEDLLERLDGHAAEVEPPTDPTSMSVAGDLVPPKQG